jgi:hypothetical protein
MNSTQSQFMGLDIFGVNDVGLYFENRLNGSYKYSYGYMGNNTFGIVDSLGNDVLHNYLNSGNSTTIMCPNLLVSSSIATNPDASAAFK